MGGCAGGNRQPENKQTPQRDIGKEEAKKIEKRVEENPDSRNPGSTSVIKAGSKLTEEQ